MPPQTSRVEDRGAGVGVVPAELGVALVASDHDAPRSRAQSTTLRRCSAGSTRPVGLDGELSQSRCDPLPARARSASRCAATWRRRGERPTSYVG